jgi:hypothetical protein
MARKVRMPKPVFHRRLPVVVAETGATPYVGVSRWQRLH